MIYLFWYLVIGAFFTAGLQWYYSTIMPVYWRPTVSGFLVGMFLWPLVILAIIQEWFDG